MSAETPQAPPVSDEELMRYLDDELDEERRGVVEAYLADDGDARDKAAGIDCVGELLREQAAADARADGIVDGVMARLDEGAAEEGEHAADVIQLPRRKPEADRVGAVPQAANDNARSIFALAAAAAAVAAGLYFWSRSGADDVSLAERRPRAAATAVASVDTESSGAAAEPKWLRSAPAEEAIEEPSAAVEVASVDFGSHTGSVFYVSTGPENAATTTAVVWVTDDVTGEAP